MPHTGMHAAIPVPLSAVYGNWKHPSLVEWTHLIQEEQALALCCGILLVCKISRHRCHSSSSTDKDEAIPNNAPEP